MFSLDQELNNTRQDLTSAKDQLLITTEELKNVKVELAQTKETLVLAEAAHMNCKSTIDGLKSDVKARDRAGQRACTNRRTDTEVAIAGDCGQ